MKNLPEIIFSRIMFYATERHRYLRHAVLWEAVCVEFSALLKRFFENDVRSIHIDFLSEIDQPTLVVIQEYESWDCLDMRFLKGLSTRVPESTLRLYGSSLRPNFGLPEGFARAISPPSSINFVFRIGLDKEACFGGMELVELLTLQSSSIKKISITPPNAELPFHFNNALKSLPALEKFELHYVSETNVHAFDVGIELLKTVGCTQPNCLILRNYRSISNSSKMKFANELFLHLENSEIRCLHLHEMEEWITEWLSDSSLHNRAKVKTLCTTNRHELYSTLFWHPLLDYTILFPCLQNICMRLEMAIDDNSFDKLIANYFERVYYLDVRVYITVHLLHKLKEFPSARLEYLKNFQQNGVRVEFEKINKTDAKYIIRSKYDKIMCLVLVCFDSHELYDFPESITTRCNRDHGDDDKRCLCVGNGQQFS